MYAKYLWEVPWVWGAWDGLGWFVCQSFIIQTSERAKTKKTFESINIVFPIFGWKTSFSLPQMRH